MIRKFREGDAEACFELLCACLRLDPHYSATLREKLLRAESPERMRERAGIFYLAVCESNSEVVGFGGLDLNEIRLLYVAPEHQGKGIGGALLDHLASMVPPALFADIFVYSTFTAVEFYHRRGFVSRGEYSFDVGGEPLTTVFMTRPA